MNSNEKETMQSKSFMCLKDGCEKAFTLKTNLKRHMKTHGDLVIPKDVNKLVCSKPWCKKEFTKKFNLQRHQLNCSSPNQDALKCFVCKKDFSKLCNLKRHLITHTNKKKKSRTNKHQIYLTQRHGRSSHLHIWYLILITNIEGK